MIHQDHNFDCLTDAVARSSSLLGSFRRPSSNSSHSNTFQMTQNCLTCLSVTVSAFFGVKQNFFLELILPALEGEEDAKCRALSLSSVCPTETFRTIPPWRFLPDLAGP
jgi:hypothetical protein